MISRQIKRQKAHQGKQLQTRFQKNNKSGIQKETGSYLPKSSFLELEGIKIETSHREVYYISFLKGRKSDTSDNEGLHMNVFFVNN